MNVVGLTSRFFSLLLLFNLFRTIELKLILAAFPLIAIKIKKKLEYVMSF